MGAGAELFYEKPLHIVRGAGVWLYDPQGRAYLDVYNNVAARGSYAPGGGAAIQRQTAILPPTPAICTPAFSNMRSGSPRRCRRI